MGDALSTKSSSSATDQSSTTNNEQIGISEGGVAIRGASGEQSDTVVNITNVPDGYLEKALETNFESTGAAIDALADVKQVEATGGQSETNKTILIGMGLGLGALVLLKLNK